LQEATQASRRSNGGIAGAICYLYMHVRVLDKLYSIPVSVSISISGFESENIKLSKAKAESACIASAGSSGEHMREVHGYASKNVITCTVRADTSVQLEIWFFVREVAVLQIGRVRASVGGLNIKPYI